MSEQGKQMIMSTADSSLADLYAAHERLESVATDFVRVLVEANRLGLAHLAALAERSAQRCMRDCLLLEQEIKARL